MSKSSDTDNRPFRFVIFVSVSQTVLEFFGTTILDNGRCYITGHFSTACDTALVGLSILCLISALPYALLIY